MEIVAGVRYFRLQWTCLHCRHNLFFFFLSMLLYTELFLERNSMSDEELIVEPLIFFEKKYACFRKQHLGSCTFVVFMNCPGGEKKRLELK